MRILVTAASKHGATGEISEIVAGVLRDAGHEVDTRPPQNIESIDSYDAVVIGSGVYAGRWLEPARQMVERHTTALAARPVWCFSSGPIGDPPLPEGDAPETLAIADRLRARGHRSFAGRLERSRLGLFDRTVTALVKAQDGDFRDWEAIRAWADQIGGELTKKEVLT